MIASTFVEIVLVCIAAYIAVRLVRRPSESPAKNHQARLARVKNASLIFSACLWLSFPLSAYWFLGFLFGWPGPGHDALRIVVSENHIYSSPSEMPPTIFWLLVVRQGLAFWAGFMLLRLFWLYGKGVIFSAKNVTCIRFLGYYLIIDWFINYEMQGLLHDTVLSMSPIFYGLFIIFFAWIMDEGRKIQEEQELTV
jgi:hypothetical protein